MGEKRVSEYGLAIYNAFSESSFGGSAAGIIADATNLESGQMQRIAKEIGAPATCFVTGIVDHRIEVRFFSTLTEYGMCGHGTIALMTWLIEQGLFTLGPGQNLLLELRTPDGKARVDIGYRDDARPEVMLTLTEASFEPCALTADELAPLFGIGVDSFSASMPVQLTRSDFTHLVVPIRDLVVMRSIPLIWQR